MEILNELRKDRHLNIGLVLDRQTHSQVQGCHYNKRMDLYVELFGVLPLAAIDDTWEKLDA